jgi:hypothetical protein
MLKARPRNRPGFPFDGILVQCTAQGIVDPHDVLGLIPGQDPFSPKLARTTESKADIFFTGTADYF